MNNAQKIKLFWKIYRHLNKKFCKNKIEISHIFLFKKGGLGNFPKKNKGWYSQDDKWIAIKKDEPLEMQIAILVHELTHAYQNQILGNYYDKKRAKFKAKKVTSRKEWDKMIHDKKGGKISHKFMKETKKLLERSHKEF